MDVYSRGKVAHRKGIRNGNGQMLLARAGVATIVGVSMAGGNW